MARGKKSAGRGHARGPYRGGGGGRHSDANSTRGRGKAPTSNAPSAAFLAALEAQRAKQTAAEEAAAQSRPPQSTTLGHSQTATVTRTAAADICTLDAAHQQEQRLKRPALPGFVFDEARGRYFKLTKHEQQLQDKKRRADAIAQAQAAEHHARLKIRPEMVGRLAARRCGWMGRLAQREISNAPALRDSSGLLPRYYGARLSTHALRSVDLALDAVRDRFTAMDINADASRVYIGYASGRLQSFVVNESCEFGQRELESHLAWSINAATVSTVRHHPRVPDMLLFAAIGASVAQPLTTLLPRGSNNEVSGHVTLFRDVHHHGQRTVAWRFADPWTAEWSPVDDAIFVVGLHRDVGTALVDGNFVGTGGRGVAFAPSGRIHSDTLSQTFSPHSGSIIVNGSRDGSWWLWDTRSPRRASEFVVDKALASSVGSLQCVRLLKDERRVVQQRSNGELSVMDLRCPIQSIVTQWSVGVKDLYRPMLRFDVDESESMVVAAMGSSVDVFDLHSGHELARVKLLHEPVSRTNGVPEQVCLRGGAECPTVWALSRSALYRSQLQKTH